MNKISDKEEILRVLDSNGDFTGKYEKRSVTHDKNLYHNEAALWIIDKANKKILMQKRSPDKRIYPNCWGICAGHMIGDETPEESIHNELYEELGIDSKKLDIKLLKKIKFNDKNNYMFEHYYYTLTYVPIENITIQEEELSEVRYIDYDEVKNASLNNNPSFVPFKVEIATTIFNILDEIMKSL